ncbi:MAG: hypothetical protein JNM17_09280 [Archangium sp.]|nr:hypothetical protein [Archangium sp.]
MRFGVAFLTLALCGCGGGLERASFSADDLIYARSGRVGLSLTNVSTIKLGVNLCLSQLISSDGKTMGPSEAATCELEPKIVEPGDSVEGRKTIPAGLTPGKWRYATTIRLPTGAGEKILTQEFDVQ